MIDVSGVKTNIVYAPGPSFYFGSVLHEPEDPRPERRFKMIHWQEQVRMDGSRVSAPGNTSLIRV